MRYIENEVADLDKVGSIDSFCEVNSERNTGLEFKSKSAWIDYSGEACILAKGIRHDYKTKMGRHVAFILSMSQAFPSITNYLRTEVSPGIFSLYTLPEAYRVQARIAEDTLKERLRISRTGIPSWTMKMLFPFSHSANFRPAPEYSCLSTPDLVHEFKAFIENNGQFPLDNMCAGLDAAIKNLESTQGGYIDNISYRLSVPAIDENLLFGKISATSIGNRVPVRQIDANTISTLQTAKIQGLVAREAFLRMNKNLDYVRLPYKISKNQQIENPMPKYLCLDAPMAELHGIKLIHEFDAPPIYVLPSLPDAHVDSREK